MRRGLRLVGKNNWSTLRVEIVGKCIGRYVISKALIQTQSAFVQRIYSQPHFISTAHLALVFTLANQCGRNPLPTRMRFDPHIGDLPNLRRCIKDESVPRICSYSNQFSMILRHQYSALSNFRFEKPLHTFEIKGCL